MTKKYREHLTLILNIIERINDFLQDLCTEMCVIHYWVKKARKDATLLLRHVANIGNETCEKREFF